MCRRKYASSLATNFNVQGAVELNNVKGVSNNDHDTKEKKNVNADTIELN